MEINKREAALQQIRENIARKGHHIYVVLGAATPRFAYTIGVSDSIGAELIFPGGSFYSNDEVVETINNIVAQLKRGSSLMPGFELSGLGEFRLRKAHPSWATRLMRGALDYYHVHEIQAFQVLPDEIHWTKDIPDLAMPWNLIKEPVWRWLYEPWPYSVSNKSVAATDLAALRGERTTEARRWEDEEWEIFVGDGPNIPKEQLRVVSLGSLVAMDESMEPVLHLLVGEGLVRDPSPNSVWRPWKGGNAEG